MKLLLLALLLPAMAAAQPDTVRVPIGIIKERCTVLSRPTYIDSDSITTLDPLSYAFLLKYVKTSSDMEWYKIITYRNKIGYISKDFVSTDSTINLQRIYRDSITNPDALDFIFSNKYRLGEIEVYKKIAYREELQNKLAAEYKKREHQGIGITSNKTTKNILGYPDVSISFVNYSPNTIKYITFTLSGYNRVNDLVETKTVKGVGPVEGYTYDALEFETAFLSKTVYAHKITGIKIEYMNGKVLTVPKDKISLLYR